MSTRTIMKNVLYKKHEAYIDVLLTIKMYIN